MALKKAADVDACPLGWCFAIVSIQEGAIIDVAFDATKSFRGALDACKDAAAIAVDIPIGLPSEAGYPRECDREAKSCLGAKRGASVFYCPKREVVEACHGVEVFREACSLAKRIAGFGFSQQTFRILRKTKEVDQCVTPASQERILEVHPELCFWALNGRNALLNSKKPPEGFAERCSLLRDLFPEGAVDEALQKFPRREVSRDDVPDALVAAYTAMRYLDGRFERIPQSPPIDVRGLRMEMIFPS